MRVRTLVTLARAQAWPLPLSAAIGIATGVLVELQSSALQPLRRHGEAGLRIATDTVWVRMDGRVWLERRRLPLAEQGGSRPGRLESGLAGVAALLVALGKDALKVPGALTYGQMRTLEIVLSRALSLDEAQRYGDAGEMQADLEAFAFDAGLDLSPRGRAHLVCERLPQRTLGRGPDLPRPPDSVPTLVSAPSPFAWYEDGGDEPTVVTRSPLAVPVIGLLVKGRLDERLDSARVAVVPGARIVVDFASADRLTDAGLAAWQTLSLAVSSCPRAALWLARVPESLLRRALQVPTLLEGAHIVSFVAPLACDGCGRCFGRLMDAERDRVDLDRRRAEGTCPRCQSRATLDAEPRYLAVAASNAAIAVPAEVRAELERLDAEAQHAPPVERLTSLPETLLCVRGPVDGAFRWGRALAGIAGPLRIAFHPTTELAREAADQLIGVLQAPPPGIASCVLVDAPASLMISLGASLMPLGAGGWLRIESLHLHGHCRVCNVIRGSTVPWEEAEAAWRAGGAVSLHCVRCRGPLEGGGDDRMRRTILPSIVPPSCLALPASEHRRTRTPVPALLAVPLALALIATLGITLRPSARLHDWARQLVAGTAPHTAAR